jgi:glycosyltransferase involved in cell wall biosynthesis
MGANLTRRIVVISAVNFSEGGALTILRECLSEGLKALPKSWDIVALVHDVRLFNFPNIQFIEMPNAKKSWLRRLYWEWFGFMKISRAIKPDLWLSLHDITPRVTAKRQAVYCHNPSPFYKITIREALLEPNFFLFNLLYIFLYKVNIKKNQYIIVQQDWLRNEFQKLYKNLPIVVAHPISKSFFSVNGIGSRGVKIGQKSHIIFLYPALPRVFKNFEVICEAIKILPESVRRLIEVRLTLSGDENRYSQYIFEKYGSIHEIKFIGKQNPEEMALQYDACDAVVFSSKLETWGLPITEAKIFNKPLLISDLPYSKETVGNYDRVCFLSPHEPALWARSFESIVAGNQKYEVASQVHIDEPYISSWKGMWHLLIEGL